MSMDISPISSKNRVPPSANSKRPTRLSMAPVKAPFSWPNSSLVMRLSGRELQWTLIKELSLRWLCWCRALATISLPTPVSPRIITVESVLATRSTRVSTRFMGGLAATKSSKCSCSNCCSSRYSFSLVQPLIQPLDFLIGPGVVQGYGCQGGEIGQHVQVALVKGAAEQAVVVVQHANGLAPVGHGHADPRFDGTALLVSERIIRILVVQKALSCVGGLADHVQRMGEIRLLDVLDKQVLGRPQLKALFPVLGSAAEYAGPFSAGDFVDRGKDLINDFLGVAFGPPARGPGRGSPW